MENNLLSSRENKAVVELKRHLKHWENEYDRVKENKTLWGTHVKIQALGSINAILFSLVDIDIENKDKYKDKIEIIKNEIEIIKNKCNKKEQEERERDYNKTLSSVLSGIEIG